MKFNPNTVYNRVLCISDPHAPYQHPDFFDWYGAINDYYQPDLIVCMGDLIDNHHPSAHHKEGEVIGIDQELDMVAEFCKDLKKMFPHMLCIEGNHDSRPSRVAQQVNLSTKWIKGYNEALGLDDGWNWAERFMVRIGKDHNCLITHDIGSSLKANSQKFSMSSVQGYHHALLGVQWYADTEVCRFSMSTGYSGWSKAPIFRYGRKNIVNKPINGCGLIIDEVAYAIPMSQDKHGRWTGRL